MLAMEELQPVTPPREAGVENPYLIPISIVMAGFIIAAAVYFQSPAANKLGASLAVKDKNIKEISLDVDGHPVLGNPAAEIAIVEFSDFQCPFCERFFNQTLASIKEKYIKTGKVKLIYRNFPISSIHPYAQKAAEAGLCANDQNKFWQMHDKIFENQTNLSVDNLKQLAADLGLPSDFNNCLDSNKYEDAVKKDFDFGASLGVGGTPTFFIGRLPMQIKSLDASGSGGNDRREYKMIVGAQPFSAFENAIDELLKK